MIKIPITVLFFVVYIFQIPQVIQSKIKHKNTQVGDFDENFTLQ